MPHAARWRRCCCCYYDSLHLKTWIHKSKIIAPHRQIHLISPLLTIDCCCWGRSHVIPSAWLWIWHSIIAIFMLLLLHCMQKILEHTIVIDTIILSHEFPHNVNLLSFVYCPHGHCAHTDTSIAQWASFVRCNALTLLCRTPENSRGCVMYD